MYKKVINYKIKKNSIIYKNKIEDIALFTNISIKILYHL